MHTDKPNERRLSIEEGRLLLNLARQAIAAELGIAQEPSVDVGRHASALKLQRGAFVTLKKAGDLRGCIGTLTADQSLAANIRTNAVNAAFRDPRFEPLTTDEWPQITIEVSVLSQPRRLAYASGEQLPERVTPHKDGVVIRKGFASATFLPQVWKQLPRPQDFLAHLCLKAGLAAEAWRAGDLEVETYNVQYFEE